MRLNNVRSTIALSLSMALAVGMGLVMSACHSPRGGMFSHAYGSSTYISNEMRQMTVSVVDVRTDEEVFVMDIPVGQQLTFDFVAGRGDDPVQSPDLMRWQLFDAGARIGRLRNSLTVPNTASRRVDVFVRQGVEYAEAPADERLRSDELANRPDWWTPEGGAMPDDSPAKMYDE